VIFAKNYLSTSLEFRENNFLTLPGTQKSSSGYFVYEERLYFLLQYSEFDTVVYPIKVKRLLKPGFPSKLSNEKKTPQISS
jgi:hypothetical protein